MICEEVGIKLENATIGIPDSAKRVIVTNANTTVVGGAGKRPHIDGAETRATADTACKW